MSIIDTPEGIEAYRKLQIYYALKIEVKTGLRHSRGSVLALAKQTFPEVTAGTKKKALEQLRVALTEQGILRNTD